MRIGMTRPFDAAATLSQGPLPHLSRGVLDPLLQVALRAGADLHVDRLAVLEQDQRRDGAHAVADRRLLVLVDVQLDDLHLAVELRRKLFEMRRDHLAGAAPFRPEIHDHRLVDASTSWAKLVSVTAAVMVLSMGIVEWKVGSAPGPVKERDCARSRAWPALFPCISAGIGMTFGPAV